MFYRKVIAAAALLTASALTCLGAESLIKNGEMKLNDAGTAIQGWQITPRDVKVSADNQKLPDGVTQSVKFTVNGVSKGDGQISQAIYLKKGETKNLVISGFMRATSPRCAYLQVKLCKGKKEFKRINVAYSKKNWDSFKQQFNTEGADKVLILCRWRRYDRYQGTTVWFADMKVTEIGKVIALVGDSTVQNYENSSNRRGWGQMLAEYVNEDGAAVNYAAGGRSTKTFRAEKRWEPVLAAKPTVVLIQFGHNDSHGEGRPEATKADGDFKENLQKYVDEAKAAGVVPVLVTPPHRRVFRSNGQLAVALAPYAKSIREVAAANQVACIDLYSYTEAEMLKLGDEKCVPLFCSRKDRSHFSEKGARMLAEYVAKELKSKTPEVAELIKVN